MKVTEKPHLHRNWIDSHAFGIVKALQKQGHTTYLVGGCVRDLLLGIVPKDYDIGTTAQPDEVRGIIYKSYVIGKRFRLVLVKRGDQQFEVATFRREIRPEEDSEELPKGDNLFGTPEEDAQRRDFTVNALFYDPVKDNLIDFANGLSDHDVRLIRMIGEPNRRLLEDPIRILRALRLAHKVKFSIEPSLRHAMQDQAESLVTSALPRRREEWLKLLRLRNPVCAFLEAFDLDILRHISPSLQKLFENDEQREVFCKSLTQFHEFRFDRDNPVELFGGFIHAFVRASIEENPLQPIRSRDYLEHDLLLPLMKDELGMFKSEQNVVARALHIQPLFCKREEFERRGQRRQMALLSSEGFPLALKFSLKDYSLSPSDWHFWYASYKEVLPEIQNLPKSAGPKRRRPKRKKRFSGPRQTNKTGSSGQASPEGE